MNVPIVSDSGKNSENRGSLHEGWKKIPTELAEIALFEWRRPISENAVLVITNASKNY